MRAGAENTTTEPIRRDPAAAAVAGLMTLAWYAVPDVVTGRGARAAAKGAVLAGGLALTLTATAEGRSALAGVRSVAGEARALRDGSDDAAGPDGGAPDAAVTELPDPRLVAGAVGAALLVTGVVTVAGEKAAHRLGERWRRRGLALPHTRVGLLVGAAAAALALLEPPRAVEPERS